MWLHPSDPVFELLFIHHILGSIIYENKVKIGITYAHLCSLQSYYDSQYLEIAQVSISR